MDYCWVDNNLSRHSIMTLESGILYEDVARITGYDIIRTVAEYSGASELASF